MGMGLKENFSNIKKHPKHTSLSKAYHLNMSQWEPMHDFGFPQIKKDTKINYKVKPSVHKKQKLYIIQITHSMKEK